jgi:hypothetical protein
MTDDERQPVLEPTSSMLRVLKSAPRDPADVEQHQRQRIGELLTRREHPVTGSETPRTTIDTTGVPKMSSPGQPSGATDSLQTRNSVPEMHPGGSQETAGSPHHQPGRTAPVQPEPTRKTRSDAGDTADESEENALWWVSFSGDLSLRRLSSLRQRLLDSPFTYDARFEEIGDGLIVLMVLTDANLTEPRLEWILGHLMDVEQLDRHAMIVSRN